MKIIIMLVALVFLTGCYSRGFTTQYLIEPLPKSENKPIESSLQSEKDAVTKIITSAIFEYKKMRFIDVSRAVNNPDLLIYYYGEQWEVSAFAFFDKDKIYVNIGCVFGPFGSHPTYKFLKDKIYQDLKSHFGERVVIDNDFSKSNALQKVFYGKLMNYQNKNNWRKVDWPEFLNYAETGKSNVK